MRDAAQRHDGLQRRQRIDPCTEERVAGLDLGRQWLVLRRHAAHRIGDHCIVERQPVPGVGLEGARGEAEVDERAIEQLARIVAGEGAAGAVGTGDTGCKARDQQPRIICAEYRHRRVEPVRMQIALLQPVCNEPRAQRAVTARLVPMCVRCRQSPRSSRGGQGRGRARGVRTGRGRSRRAGRSGQ